MSPPSRAPLHVLEVIGNAIVGGMESWVERFIERTLPGRIRFTALCPADGAYARRLRELGVDVHILPMADDPAWSSVQTAAALVQAGGVDLLHAHLPRAHVLAGLVGRLTGRPVLATIHGRQLTGLDLEVHRATGSHLSVVCRASFHGALGLGVSPALLSCDPNGVDTERFAPRRPAPTALRDSCGLGVCEPLVGFVGRLSPEKGPEVFVRLLQRLPAHGVFIGDGPLRAALQAACDAAGLSGRLHFAGLREDMAAVYNELDILVSTSHAEALPLALMEGMASGLPVVATRVGGVPELVAHGETGWLAGPGDVDELAGRCAALLADAALRRRMGEAGRRRVMARFDLGANVEAVGRLMEQLAGGERVALRA